MNSVSSCVSSDYGSTDNEINSIRAGRQPIKGLGRKKVVITTTGKSKIKKQLKESAKDEWFHAMQQDRARKETEALGPSGAAIGKKVYKKTLKEKLKGDQSEYYFKKAYGINVHGKEIEGTQVYTQAEANKKGLRLDQEYALFDDKKDQEAKKRRKLKED